MSEGMTRTKKLRGTDAGSREYRLPPMKQPGQHVATETAAVYNPDLPSAPILAMLSQDSRFGDALATIGGCYQVSHN